MTDPIYFTTREVADLLGVKFTSSVIALVTHGELPCGRPRQTRAGRTQYYFTESDIRAYLDVYDAALVPALNRLISHKSQQSEQSEQSAPVVTP